MIAKTKNTPLAEDTYMDKEEELRMLKEKIAELEGKTLSDEKIQQENKFVTFGQPLFLTNVIVLRNMDNPQKKLGLHP